MPARHRTVLFDLDGTLIDHFQAIHRCHTHVRRHYGLPDATREEVMRAVGGGLPEALRRTLGPAHAHRLEEALPIYRAHWDRTMLDDVELLPGARELLTALHAAGARCAVFTNKHGPSSRRICTHFGLDHLLALNLGATDTPWLKPEVDFTHHALRQIDTTPADTALVGDSPWDVEAARVAGLAGCYAVTTGTHDAAALLACGAHSVHDSLVDLLPLLAPDA